MNTAVEETIMRRADVETAASWLAGRVVRTPVLSSASLDRATGARLWLKAENLQVSGSYKYRGALHAVGRLHESGHGRGVIAQSTGNHALAVALAAREYGMPAIVVVPADAPRIKITQAEDAGARVILAGATAEERLQVVAQLQAEYGYTVIDAYDHPDVVAGQGSASLELIEEVEQQGAALDALVVPVGGAGGLAGACLAAQGRGIAVYGVEPVGCDALFRSLARGRRVTVNPVPTLADGLRPSKVGQLPFEIARGGARGVLRVNDEAIAEALRLTLFTMKLLVEPSGAAGLAGALQLRELRDYSHIGVILTGGNIEPAVLAQLIAESDPVRIGRAA